MEPQDKTQSAFRSVKEATDQKLHVFFEAQKTETLKAIPDFLDRSQVGLRLDDAQRNERRRTNSYFERSFEDVRPRSVQPVSGLELHDAVEALTMQGGKRFRAMLLATGLASVQGEISDQDLKNISTLGASMELLQTYLLIHDDWMDKDESRRGGPSTFARFRQIEKDFHVADSLAILAGDLAFTYAWSLFIETPFPANQNSIAQQTFLQIQKQVYWGQLLDLKAHQNVALMHQLKTTSYTIQGPLFLGTLLFEKTTHTDEISTDWLDEVSTKLGKAFQYRDDWLGTFGDPEITGKPQGHDLREGKMNAVTTLALEKLPGTDRIILDDVFGNPNANENRIHELIAMLKKHNIHNILEKELLTILHEFHEQMEHCNIKTLGKEMLIALSHKLILRNH